MLSVAHQLQLGLSALPPASAALAGSLVRLTTNGKPYWCNGTTWVDLSGVVGASAPVSVGTVATGTAPNAVAVAGQYAYVANRSSNTLEIFNVANPAAPVSVGLILTGTSPYSVAVAGQYAYVACQSNGTLQIFNVANPAAPVSVGTVATGAGPSAVAVAGQYAYVTDSNNTLQIFDTGSLPASASSVLASALAVYSTLLDCSGSHIAARVAGTYAIGQGDPLAISGTGTLYPIKTINIVAADYAAAGSLPARLRIRAQLYTNDVAPTGNYTFGLYPITRPATSGAAGQNIYTLGTVVPGSDGAVFTAPAADLLGGAVSADFPLPADGHYVIGVRTTTAVAASAHVHVSAQLQCHNA